jgi:hypothetical protein
MAFKQRHCAWSKALEHRLQIGGQIGRAGLKDC